MKSKILISIYFILLSISSNGQLIFEGTYNDRFKTIQLDNGEIKYLKFNTEDNVVSIYNLNRTVWKNIHVPLPDEHILDEIKSITQTTFNKDTLVELVYSCVNYRWMDALEDPEKDAFTLQFTLNIINEASEMILRVPDSSEMEILDKNGKRKLLIYKQIGKWMENEGQTLIYSLPNK